MFIIKSSFGPNGLYLTQETWYRPARWAFEKEDAWIFKYSLDAKEVAAEVRGIVVELVEKEY